MRILILDTETSGLDPAKDELLEIGYAVWCTAANSLLYCESNVLRSSKTNPAFGVNGIGVELLTDGFVRQEAFRRVDETMQWMSEYADAVTLCVAHNAAFDRQWVKGSDFLDNIPWACSMDEIDWPKAKPGLSLEKLALNHGVAVMPGHRAIYDVLTLCRVFEAVAQTTDVDKLLVRALRPRTLVRALVSYETNHLAKELGFRWEPTKKMWLRRVPIEEIPALPFKTEIVTS